MLAVCLRDVLVANPSTPYDAEESLASADGSRQTGASRETEKPSTMALSKSVGLLMYFPVDTD
jgi:hypothetical protein